MTDKRDICERVEERLDMSKHHDAGLLDGWTLPGVKDLLLEAKAEIEALRHDIYRLRGDVSAMRAVAQACDDESAELEAQRNAAWRALAYLVAGEGSVYAINQHTGAFEAAATFAAAEQASKEGK